MSRALTKYAVWSESSEPDPTDCQKNNRINKPPLIFMVSGVLRLIRNFQLIRNRNPLKMQKVKRNAEKFTF